MIIKKGIHTTIPEEYYNKLLLYADEKLRAKNHKGVNTAIINLIKLAEQKNITVRVVTDITV